MKRTWKRGPTRFPGIIADAATLGVNRCHLYMVLAGIHVSNRLTARYQALKAAQSAAGMEGKS